MIVFLNLKHFFERFFETFSNVFVWVVGVLAYLIGYPAQESILIFAIVLFVMDIITKFNAIRVQNKGLCRAFINGKISSRSFWDGFITKIIGYFVILVMANLANITPQIGFAGKNIITPILYTGLAFYEVISNLENLRDANFLVAIPILKKIKKEQDNFFE
ncbi:MAG: Bacteriophage holin family [Clostridium butyricum]|jgi:phage-related holin|nr:Bacteriophage holin family [Clostridium butyricum]MDN5318006.1 Bacteriophage holin family [Thermoanaerobacterium sp.]